MKKEKRYHLESSESTIPKEMIGKTQTVARKNIKMKQKNYWWKGRWERRSR